MFLNPCAPPAQSRVRPRSSAFHPAMDRLRTSPPYPPKGASPPCPPLGCGSRRRGADARRLRRSAALFRSACPCPRDEAEGQGQAPLQRPDPEVAPRQAVRLMNLPDGLSLRLSLSAPRSASPGCGRKPSSATGSGGSLRDCGEAPPGDFQSALRRLMEPVRNH